jgi:biopolymer transport protein TolR
MAIGASSEGPAGRAGGGSAYAAMRRKRPRRAIGEINVTPLVDVVLVLLLVFMVTAPMMSRGIDVSLPVADQPNIPPEDRKIMVTVNARGTVYLNDKPLALPLLEEQVRGQLQGMSMKVAYLRADEALRYGKVIEVVDVLKRAGVDQIGFAYDLPSDRATRR